MARMQSWYPFLKQIYNLNFIPQTKMCWWANMRPSDSNLYSLFNHLHDNNPRKINLGVDIERDNDGNLVFQKVVRKAEELVLAANEDKEHLPFFGNIHFCDLSSQLIFGENSEEVKSGRIATIQTPGSYGALRLVKLLLKKFKPLCTDIFIAKPECYMHLNLIKHLKFTPRYYRYYNFNIQDFDQESFVTDLMAIPPQSVVIFQVCGHNPTGVDPSEDDWNEICNAIKQSDLFIIFDFPYQGIISGNVDHDAYPIRLFARNGFEFAVCHSFSKNMTLFGERIGSLSLLMDSKETVAKLMSQLEVIVRNYYFSPPIHGARIVTAILSDKQLREQWLEEVKNTAARLTAKRKLFHDCLQKLETNMDWKFVTKQKGLYSLTGFGLAEVEELAKTYNIYLTKDGRMTFAGVNTNNMPYLAESFCTVTKSSESVIQ